MKQAIALAVAAMLTGCGPTMKISTEMRRQAVTFQILTGEQIGQLGHGIDRGAGKTDQQQKEDSAAKSLHGARTLGTPPLDVNRYYEELVNARAKHSLHACNASGRTLRR